MKRYSKISKSVACKGVLVRVRPGAPIQSIKPPSARHARCIGMGAKTENLGESIWVGRRQSSSDVYEQFLNSPVRHQLVDGIAVAEATGQLARRRCLQTG